MELEATTAHCHTSKELKMKYRLLAAILAVLCSAAPAFAASSYTACERLENPVPGDPAVRNAWGTIENTGRSLADTAVAGTISISVAGSSNVTLTQADGGADQSRNAHYIFTGALTGNISVFWPVYCRAFSVFNNTTGAFTLTVAVTGTPGTTVLVPQGSTMYLVSDGTNISQRIVGTIGGTAGALTLPAGPETIVGRATTDTLTNKTLTAPTIATITNGGALTLPAGVDTLVARTSTDTLTNKTLTSPTVSGTVAGTPTFSGNVGFQAKILNGAASNGIFYTVTNANLANGGTLDLDLLTGGGSFAGTLDVSCIRVSDGNFNTGTVFAVQGRAAALNQATLLTGTGAGANSFTLTMPSNGVFRVTNTSGNASIVTVTFTGHTS